MKKRIVPVVLLLGCLLTFTSGCASFPWLRPQPQVPLPPAAFLGPPTLQDAISVVNGNSDRIQQLQTENARLSLVGIPAPALRADIVYENPKRMRMRAELPLGVAGRQMDIGSNDEVFWMWLNDEVMGMRIPNAPRSPLYFARHAEFAQSPIAGAVPIEPSRFIELLGLVRFDPAMQHDGPFAVGADRFEIRSRIPSPQGDWIRIVRFDNRYGWILEQQILDSRGAVLAVARNSQHRFYPFEAVSLPHEINIQLVPGQPGQLAFRIEVTSYLINQLYGDATQLWTMPQIDGHPVVNLADPNTQPQIPASASTRSPQPYPANYPQMGYRPEYRGLRELR